MEENDKKSRLETAESQLNSQQFKDEAVYTDLEKPEFKVADDWDTADGEEGKKKKDTAAEVSKYFAAKKGSLIKYVLIISFVFFIGAFAFAALTLWRGSNISSPNNVEVSIVGPSSVDGGKETNLQIVVKNKNTVALSDVELYLEFTRSIEVLGFELENQRLNIPIGELEEGGIANETIKVVFWGEEREQKIIAGQLEYRFDGSNAELKKDVEYTVDILSSPINLTVDMLKEATSGQEMEMRVTVSSEKEDPIENALLEIDYPNGFTFTGSIPEPTFAENRWQLGTLDTFRDKEILIRGIIVGEDTEEKSFRTTVGTTEVDDEKMIHVALNRIIEKVTLVEPFIGLRFKATEGDEKGFRAVPGDRNTAILIEWINNDETNIIDMEIEVAVSGHFTPEKTSVRQGFFRTLDDTVIWNQQTNPALAVVEGGEEGSQRVVMRVSPTISATGELTQNPEIVLEAIARGRRISDLNVPVEIGVPIVQYVRVITESDLIAKVVRGVGPFKNSGPLPPVADIPSTYTIIWQVTNTSNDLEDAVVRTILPTYVEWVGAYAPRSEDVSYDETTGEVTWRVPKVSAGTGITTSAKELAFQVRVTPSKTQVGDIIDITKEIFFTATDSFTKVELEEEKKELDTQLNSDPTFERDDARVVSGG